MLENKSESHFKDYLKDVSNDQLLQFYEDLEWTPFPLLILREYQRRFKATNKEVKDKLKAERILANERTMALKDLAERGSKISKAIRNRTSQSISSSYNTARRWATSERDVLVLEKLGDLRKKGIITKKEFEEKKKEILERI